MIEVETLKEMIYDLHGYKESDKKYNFFYDETNNYRKVRIAANGFNDNRVLIENYVIGGICFKSNVTSESILKLKNKLKIDQEHELKSAQLFRGKKKFEDCIVNRNLSIILDWILKNAYIHYADMDSFYYTIIDIVDSVCADEIGILLPQDLLEAIKDELYFLLKDNIGFFVELCAKTNYPNIDEENIEFFCNALIFLIEKEIEANQEKYFVLETFRQLLKTARKSNELVFLQNNENDTIVESFHNIRQQKCIIFQKSFHIFDNEENDKKNMKNEKMILKDGSELLNYEFADSKKYFEIQLSDCIVALMSKYLKFLSYNSVEYIDNSVKKMNETGKENLWKLIKIIDKSDKENKFFIESINSQRINLNRNIMNSHIETLLKMQISTNFLKKI